MSNSIHKLSAVKVKKLAETGIYPDGGGLYLRVSPTLTKSWVYRYYKSKKEHRHGLGSYPAITLEAARKAARSCAELRQNNQDPIKFKQQEKANTLREDQNKKSFKWCALEYIKSHRSGWKNAKHANQWETTLSTYAFPLIGHLHVQEINTSEVMKVLDPIWYTKTETAMRVRQRIESVLSWAKIMNYRTGENSALWRGHIDQLLPKRTKVQKVKHYPAMPYLDLPEYYSTLSLNNATAANALKLLILTAVRTGEARLAQWDEIDLNTKIWTIPSDRTKTEKEHRVPLTPDCIRIIKEMKKTKTNEYVFHGERAAKAISAQSLLKILKQSYSNYTVHGFRSTFRDWCAEMTNFSGEVCESALAHSIKNDTEAAYRRGDLLEKRRKLMIAWATYCKRGNKISNVTPINKGNKK